MGAFKPFGWWKNKSCAIQGVGESNAKGQPCLSTFAKIESGKEPQEKTETKIEVPDKAEKYSVETDSKRLESSVKTYGKGIVNRGFNQDKTDVVIEMDDLAKKNLSNKERKGIGKKSRSDKKQTPKPTPRESHSDSVVIQIEDDDVDQSTCRSIGDAPGVHQAAKKLNSADQDRKAIADLNVWDEIGKKLKEDPDFNLTDTKTKGDIKWPTCTPRVSVPTDGDMAGVHGGGAEVTSDATLEPVQEMSEEELEKNKHELISTLWQYSLALDSALMIEFSKQVASYLGNHDFFKELYHIAKNKIYGPVSQDALTKVGAGLKHMMEKTGDRWVKSKKPFYKICGGCCLCEEHAFAPLLIFHIRGTDKQEVTPYFAGVTGNGIQVNIAFNTTKKPTIALFCHNLFALSAGVGSFGTSPTSVMNSGLVFSDDGTGKYKAEIVLEDFTRLDLSYGYTSFDLGGGAQLSLGAGIGSDTIEHRIFKLWPGVLIPVAQIGLTAAGRGLGTFLAYQMNLMSKTASAAFAKNPHDTGQDQYSNFVPFRAVHVYQDDVASSSEKDAVVGAEGGPPSQDAMDLSVSVTTDGYGASGTEVYGKGLQDYNVVEFSVNENFLRGAVTAAVAQFGMKGIKNLTSLFRKNERKKQIGTITFAFGDMSMTVPGAWGGSDANVTFLFRPVNQSYGVADESGKERSKAYPTQRVTEDMFSNWGAFETAMNRLSTDELTELCDNLENAKRNVGEAERRAHVETQTEEINQEEQSLLADVHLEPGPDDDTVHTVTADVHQPKPSTSTG